MLEALRSQTLADGVENSLLEYIRGNNMQIGDTLPKEKDLAESLGVSRHIVREGISRLKALGLVESRKKRGMVMKRPCAFEGMRKLTEVNLFQKQDRKELIEMRVALEIGMTDFIYAHKTPERIAALRKVAGVPGSSVQDCETEINFHSALMAFAENRMVIQFREILIAAFTPLSEGDILPNFKRKTPTHNEICDVLENGTADEFHSIMRNHFRPYIDSEIIQKNE